MPKLDEFHQNNKHDISVLTMNLGENLEAVQSFIEEGNYQVPVLMDNDLQTAIDYQILYTPTTIIINEDGIITSRQ